MNGFMDQINGQMETLPFAVNMWMNWMTVIFLASIPFAWKNTGARWAMAAIVLSIPAGFLVFYIVRTVHLLGIVHIVLWGPLFVYLYIVECKSESFKKTSPYGVWVILLMLTIATSLVFDVRDIVLVSLGEK